MQHARALPGEPGGSGIGRGRGGVARRIGAVRGNGGAGTGPVGDDHHLLRQPGAGVGDFGEGPGDFFIHRNIANLVPPHEPDGRSHGTSAAVEYAVIALGIRHLIVMGHHGCGGVRGCHDMLAGLAPALDMPTSFVGTWLRILKLGYEALSGRGLDYEARIRALEKEAVLVSLGNLMTFPFVAEAVLSRTARAPRRVEGHPRWQPRGLRSRRRRSSSPL